LLVRLLLGVVAYNLGNLLRRLALPLAIQNWSLTSLPQRLFKTGGRLIRYARYDPNTRSHFVRDPTGFGPRCTRDFQSWTVTRPIGHHRSLWLAVPALQRLRASRKSRWLPMVARGSDTSLAQAPYAANAPGIYDPRLYHKHWNLLILLAQCVTSVAVLREVQERPK
jgi:hypothetical protein